MSDELYLDASILVALFIKDALSQRADRFLRSASFRLIVSDFAAAEFVSAAGNRVRMGTLTRDQARNAFATFDAWTARVTHRVRTTPADIVTAEAYLRRLDLTLRTPDAINIALAQRANAALASFDDKMIAGARALGTAVAPTA